MLSTVVKYSSTEKEIYIKIIYSHPKIEDLNEIMKIENSGFSEEKAATEESMKERIEKIADTFILAYNEKQQPIGYIVGPATDERYISDELFDYVHPYKAECKYQTILSLVISPDYKRLGIAGELMHQLALVSKSQNRQFITLTCLKELIPFYEKHGYVLEGIAGSKHANMTYEV